jgi:hypothetical protein
MPTTGCSSPSTSALSLRTLDISSTPGAEESFSPACVGSGLKPSWAVRR